MSAELDDLLEELEFPDKESYFAALTAAIKADPEVAKAVTLALMERDKIKLAEKRAKRAAREAAKKETEA